jgi:hypothetical protein
MTTYLTSLVKRALGEGSAVKPVLPPSWATPPGTWGDAFPETSAESLAQPASPSRARRIADALPGAELSAGPAPLPRAPLSQQPAAPAPAHEIRRPPLGTSPEPVPTPTPPPASQAERPRATAHGATGETPRAPTPEAIPAPLVAQPRPSDVTPVPSPVHAPAPPMDISGARLSRPEVTVEPVVRQDAPNVATPVSREQSAVPATAALSLPLEQQVVPAIEIAPRPASERIVPMPNESHPRTGHPAGGMAPARHGAQPYPPPPAPPTIRVSIGRIEVRAVMPPAPTPAPAPPAAPLLTLEAYLRERTGRPDR